MDLWQTWCMHGTENPTNVVRIHEGPQTFKNTNDFNNKFKDEEDNFMYVYANGSSPWCKRSSN